MAQPLSQNQSASRTLDQVARGARRVVPISGGGSTHRRHDPLWPHVPWQLHLAFILLSGLALLLAYSNSFGPGSDRAAERNWTLDNKYIIELDPRTKATAKLFSPTTWKDATAKACFNDIWTRDYWWPKGISGLYRPIVTFTYWFNWYVQSGDETKLDRNLSFEAREKLTDTIVRERLIVFHLVNYFCHWLVTVLAYFVALMLTKRFWTAAAIALLFGVHPVNVESVTNIIGRADIFASITVFGGLLLFVRATRSRSLWKVPWLIALGLLSFFGVFSKESAIAVIAVVGLYDAVYRVPWRQLFPLTQPMIVDLLKLAMRIGLIALISICWWKVTLDGMLPTITSWIPAATPAAPNPPTPVGYTLMLLFAAASVLGLIVAAAIIPYGRQRFWWLLAIFLPVLYVITVIAIGYRQALAWIFLISVAGLAAWELLLQPSSDDLEPAVEGEPTPGNPWRWLADHYLVFIPVVVALFLVRSAVFAATTPPETPFLDNPIRGVNWYAGRITAFQVMARLWGLLLLPIRLCCDYSFNQVPTFGRLSSPLNDTMGILATVLVISVFIIALMLWKRNKAATFFIMFFYLAYLPTSNIIVTIGSIMAERFMYLPMIGFVGCLVLTIEWLVHRYATKPAAQQASAFRPPSWIAPAIFAVIAVLYGVRTFARNKDWRSDLTLWQAAKDVSPGSFRSYQSYAFALFEEAQIVDRNGQPDKARRQPETADVTIDDCIKWIERGRPIVDQLPDRHNSSRLYLHQGMYWGFKAETVAERLPDGRVHNTPATVACFIRSADALERGRQVDRAFNEVNRQKELERGKMLEDIPDAGLVQVYDFLGIAYSRLGQIERAFDSFQYLRRLDCLNPDAYEKIAATYMQAGRHEDAVITLIQILWLDQSRRGVWPLLEQEFKPLQQAGQPPSIVRASDGQPKLNPASQTVRSALCSAYQRLLRIFLECRQLDAARMVREVAVQSGFPQGLFDDLYREFNREPPPLPERPNPGSDQKQK